MSQADELLATLMASVIEHEHPVTDSNSHFIIDPNTHVISNGSEEENVIMQYDHNSEIYTFEIPRFVEGHDMMLCNRVRIHYIIIDDEGFKSYSDVDDGSEVEINKDNPDTVITTWRISRNATSLVGTLNFLVQYMCVADDGETVVYEWHTDIYTNVRIKPGMNNGEQAVSKYSDILESWYQKLFGAGDTVIADIQSTTNEQKAAIEAKGAETLATIPEDYTATYNMASEALRTRANAIVETVEGETIVANDCSDDYLRGFKMYGKTSQVTTTGKQLFDKNSAVVGMLEEDGTVTTDGAYLTSDFIPVLPNTAYYQTQKDSIRGKYYDADKNPLSETWDVQITTAATFATFANAYYLRVTVSASLADSYMLNVGTVGEDYEPYSGGVASPSPEWPQELVSIENPTIGIYGVNIANAQSIEAGANTSATATEDGYVITCIGGADKPYTSSPIQLPMEMLGGKTVILEADSITNSQDSSGKGGNVQLNIRDSVKMKYVAISPNNLRAITTIPEDVTRVDLNVYTNNSADLFKSENTTVIKGLRLTVVDSEWDSYKEEQTLVLNRTLPGIPVKSGGNYTDVNGLQWICDEIDFERGVYIQRITSKVLDGETVRPYQAVHSNGQTYCAIYPGDCIYTSPVMSNRYASNVVNWSDLDNSLYGTGGAVVINDSRFTSVEEIVSILQTELPEIYYVLATPIETPLTDEELFNFSQLHSNHPTTTVLNDSGVKMEVSYNADTKAYFNNSRGASDEQVAAAVDAWLTNYFANAE